MVARLGYWQQQAGKALTEAPSVPLPFGNHVQFAKDFYERLEALGVALGVANPVRSAAIHVLYVRGPRWADYATKYDWPLVAPTPAVPAAVTAFERAFAPSAAFLAGDEDVTEAGDGILARLGTEDPPEGGRYYAELWRVAEDGGVTLRACLLRGVAGRVLDSQEVAADADQTVVLEAVDGERVIRCTASIAAPAPGMRLR